MPLVNCVVSPPGRKTPLSPALAAILDRIPDELVKQMAPNLITIDECKVIASEASEILLR